MAGCKLYYFVNIGEDDPSQGQRWITVASARVTLGPKLFKDLRQEACSKGHAQRWRVGRKTVFAVRRRRP